MCDTDERFIRYLSLFLVVLGLALTLFWDSDDDVESARPVLGRTNAEVKSDPIGKDQNLVIYQQRKNTKGQDDENK
ncbi:MAG: hypothetical protein ACI97A_002565 [Planctomycetota bacterium]|jgi:hypothetical protein